MNLLNSFEKKAKKWSASLAFYCFFPTLLINLIKHEHSCKTLYIHNPHTNEDAKITKGLTKAKTSPQNVKHSKLHKERVDCMDGCILGLPSW